MKPSKRPEKILRPVKRISGGAKVPHCKNTAEMATVFMPDPDAVYIPLSQHIGAPAEPVVKEGDSVCVGTLIAKAAGYVSANIFSSVSGIVKGIETKVLNHGVEEKCIVIESDGKQTPDENLKPFKINNAKDLSDAALACGLVGLGGAGFPTHVKLAPPENCTIDTLIINAAECEPYLTSDYRECMEYYEDVLQGVYMIKDALSIDKVVIGVESNKPKAIEQLMRIAADFRDEDNTVQLMKLPSSYPQGAEKVIIYSATGRMPKPGQLPSDVGCIVMNITSVATLYRFTKTGMPLVRKRITIDGTAVNSPQNISVAIGTRIQDVLEFSQNADAQYDKIIMGGPMMGVAQISGESVIEKRTNGILLMKKTKPVVSTACIRCGRCIAACPMGLLPAQVETAYKFSDIEKYKELNVNTCMECGSCSFVCPAKRDLTQILRIAKSELRRQKQ